MSVSVVCMRCNKTVATVHCPYCHDDVFLCAECLAAHCRLMHDESVFGKEKKGPKEVQSTLTLGPYTWTVKTSPTVGTTITTVDVRKKRGKSKKAVDREAITKYIQDMLSK